MRRERARERHRLRQALHRRRAHHRRHQRRRPAVQRGRANVAGDGRRTQKGRRSARRRVEGARELRRRAWRRHLRRAAQSIRDQLPQPRVAGNRSRRSRRPSGVRPAARYVSHEYRGAVDWRCDPIGGAEAEAPARVRKRPRRRRHRATCRGTKSSRRAARSTIKALR